LPLSVFSSLRELEFNAYNDNGVYLLHTLNLERLLMLLVSYQKSNSGRNGDEESARRRSVIRMADKIFQIPFKLSVPLASKHSSQGFFQHFAGGSGSFTSEHRKNVNVKTFWLLLFERLLFQQLSKAETKTINPKLRISEESQLKWVAGFV
jgi:hypothetical protein